MDKIKSKFILEIMGRPPEHIKDALKQLIDKIGAEKGVKILGNTLHEPKKVEKSESLFSTFAEIEAEFESVEFFFAILISYMPSHVEVFHPDGVNFRLDEINSFSNFLLSRLHRYDEIVKVALAERNRLVKQLEFIKNGGKIEDLADKTKRAEETLKQEQVTEKKDSKSKSKKKKKS